MTGLLSENKWYILNFVLELDRRVEEIEKELSSLPGGNIVKRTSAGKSRYRYIVWSDNKQTEKTITTNEVNELSKQITKRESLKADLKIIDKVIKANLKMYETILKEADKLLADFYDKSNTVLSDNNFRTDELTQVSSNGVRVRSKSEMLLTELFEKKNLCYEYEHELYLRGYIKPWHPDFWFYEPLSGKYLIWEHCGMYSKKYELYFENKMIAYKENGFVEGNNLIITKDDKNGSLNMLQIERIINKVFFLEDYKDVYDKFVARKNDK